MSQLSALCEALGITLRTKLVGERSTALQGDAWQRREWRVTLCYGRRSWSFPYFTGLAVGEPTVADVVSSISAYALAGRDTFADFYRDLGYSEDSRKAHAAWVRCKQATARLEKLFGRQVTAQLARAEH